MIPECRQESCYWQVAVGCFGVAVDALLNNEQESPESQTMILEIMAMLEVSHLSSSRVKITPYRWSLYLPLRPLPIRYTCFSIPIDDLHWSHLLILDNYKVISLMIVALAKNPQRLVSKIISKIISKLLMV